MKQEDIKTMKVWWGKECEKVYAYRQDRLKVAVTVNGEPGAFHRGNRAIVPSKVSIL